MAEQEFLSQFFEVKQLPPHLQAVSVRFGELAEFILTLPRNPERTVALRKLLEAKDCGVRAVVAADNEARAKAATVETVNGVEKKVAPRFWLVEYDARLKGDDRPYERQAERVAGYDHDDAKRAIGDLAFKRQLEITIIDVKEVTEP